MSKPIQALLFLIGLVALLLGVDANIKFSKIEKQNQLSFSESQIRVMAQQETTNIINQIVAQQTQQK